MFGAPEQKEMSMVQLYGKNLSRVDVAAHAGDLTQFAEPHFLGASGISS